MAIIQGIYFFGGILLILVSIPLILRKIPPNPVYGFRVQWTMEDPDLWYPVNAYAGKWLVFVGICNILSSWGLTLIPGITLAAYAFACLGIFVVAFTLGIVKTVHFLQTTDEQK